MIKISREDLWILVAVFLVIGVCSGYVLGKGEGYKKAYIDAAGVYSISDEDLKILARETLLSDPDVIISPEFNGDWILEDFDLSFEAANKMDEVVADSGDALIEKSLNAKVAYFNSEEELAENNQTLLANLLSFFKKLFK